MQMLINHQRKKREGWVSMLCGLFSKRMSSVFNHLVRIYQMRIEYSFSTFSRIHPFFHFIYKNLRDDIHFARYKIAKFLMKKMYFKKIFIFTANDIKRIRNIQSSTVIYVFYLQIIYTIISIKTLQLNRAHKYFM